MRESIGKEEKEKKYKYMKEEGVRTKRTHTKG